MSQMPADCAGYVRRVTHDERASAVGENSRDVLGTPAHPIPKGRRNNSMPRKRAKGQSVVASGEPRSAPYGKGRIARASITEDGSTRPLAERLEPEPFCTQDEGAVPGTLAGRMGTTEVSGS